MYNLELDPIPEKKFLEITLLEKLTKFEYDLKIIVLY